ncbi:Microcystin-dependent protein [Pseudomonas sp. UC 17F4]|uniref:phage tail-collar fiber domain-containing protein n=1 Tax=Pseudomonas sp. UC 17F4 TaxID=1855328 RepID=UPI00087FE1B2|nr:phage tail protein [Pseudomonas sp. UC 17F4]SDQ55105.1 Microcystin-dependent protein [Pseudomonas sp. UC 17F4]
MARITLAGESLIAQKQGSKQALIMAKFIFANVPGLDPKKPIDRAAPKPPANQIVYTYQIPAENTGYVNPNQVVYSSQLGSDIGDFDWNWMGLETTEGVLFAVAYVPLQQKRKNIPPLQLGNNVTRNVLVEFNGAQELTGITIDAKTWQHDFTVRLAGIDERERLSNRDVFGRATFLGSAFQLEKVGTAYQLKSGQAYVEGIRIDRPTLWPVTVPAVPTKAWMDVYLQRQGNDVVAAFSVVFGASKVDYTDSVGNKHYVVPLADLPNTTTITDLRATEPVAGDLVRHFAARNGDYPQLRARATTKDDVDLGNIPNAISHDANNNSQAVLPTTAMVQAVRAILQNAINAIISGASIAGRAAKLATARTISLTGSASGSATFDGSADVSIAVTVDPAKHTHTIAQTTGLQVALDAKLPLSGGTVTGKTGFHLGINGGYGGGNGGSDDWGACVWGLGPGYCGGGASATYEPTGSYGMSWLRARHPVALGLPTPVGEGLYLFQNGSLRSAIASSGVWTAGKYYGNGEGLTNLNANHLNAGTVPVARLSGAYNINIGGTAAAAFRWTYPRTITFTGGATGSVSMDGTSNVSVDLTVAPAAHTHVIAQVSGLEGELLAAAPPGMIAPFAMGSVPAGWLRCNGAAVSRTAYARLFGRIGTHYGVGDGSSTFNLPDLRGEFIRGLDEGRNVDAGRPIGSFQASQNLSHAHTATVSTDPGHAHTVNGSTSSNGSHTHSVNMGGYDIAGAHPPITAPGAAAEWTAGAISVAGDHTHTFSTTSVAAGVHSHTVAIALNGGVEARPRNVALPYCIKY